MRTRIAHGATVDIPTQREIADIIAQAFTEQPASVYTRLKGSFNLNASGAGQSVNADLKASSQYDWRIERCTISGSGAANALVIFYENIINPSDMMETIQLGTAGLYSDSFSNDLYVPATSQLLIVASGGVANAQISYNLQIEQIKHRDLS